MVLSVTAVLIFQGCVLMNTRILPNNPCPEYPVDCFVFNSTSYAPISEHITFRCNPNNDTQFPSGLTDPTALCFGWIIKLQTTKNILDQLGVCTGLVGLFTVLLAVIVYLGKSIKTFILCLLFTLACAVTFILLIVYKWSFSPLTFAVLILAGALGIFGLVLCCVLPKPKEKNIGKQTVLSNLNEINFFSAPVKSPLPPTTAPYRTKFLERSSKVTPE